MNILTIDTGTTNTRVTAWQDGDVVVMTSCPVGVRDTAITGSTAKLEKALRDTIAGVLFAAGMTESDIGLVLASGMITSNMGLCEIPHVPAPAGIDELAAAVREVRIERVWHAPIAFVPGVRNAVADIGLHNVEAMDMMRGEETEALALVERLALAEPAVIALPGSHSKFVGIDAEGRIDGCVTTLAGELLQVISHETILAGSLPDGFADDIDKEMLLAGAAAARRVGLGRACFSVRILDQFTDRDTNARANFLLGAVLASDILTLKHSSAIRMRPDTRFVVSGKPILRDAIALLVDDDDFFTCTLTVVGDDMQSNLAGAGAIAVARRRGLVA